MVPLCVKCTAQIIKADLDDAPCADCAARTTKTKHRIAKGVASAVAV